MNQGPPLDWDPLAEDVLRDQRLAYDRMRERCPVAYSEFMHWSLFRHEDVSRVLRDPETFSNAVSQHVSVPNGMDPPDHTRYRRLIEPYFAAERIRAFEPVCQEIATGLVRTAVSLGEAEVMDVIALPFAALTQCAFLGWPSELHGQLVDWTRRNLNATRNQDRQVLSEIAGEFQKLVSEILATRPRNTASAAIDVTAMLMGELVQEQPLTKEALASILRNWTMGEVGTISAAVGIVLHFLAEHSEVLQLLRMRPELLTPAIDEILRMHGPLVSNRRIATREVEIGGRKLPAGARITLMWISANRDGRVFEDPQSFRLDRNPGKNLLFGEGIHVCPAAPLARMELRVMIEQVLKQTTEIQLPPGRSPTNAQYPASGFHTLPLSFKK